MPAVKSLLAVPILVIYCRRESERYQVTHAQRYYRKSLQSTEAVIYAAFWHSLSIHEKPEHSQKREIGIVYGVDAAIHVQVCIYSLRGENDSVLSIVATSRSCQFSAVSSGLD